VVEGETSKLVIVQCKACAHDGRSLGHPCPHKLPTYRLVLWHPSDGHQVKHDGAGSMRCQQSTRAGVTFGMRWYGPHVWELCWCNEMVCRTSPGAVHEALAYYSLCKGLRKYSLLPASNRFRIIGNYFGLRRASIDARPTDSVFMIPCLHAHDKTRSSRSVLIADS